MLMLSGYYRKDWEAHVDTQKEISLNSAGRFRLDRLARYETTRPLGRDDYHMLYVANGSATFEIQGETYRANTGDVALYYPKEPHKYYYVLEEQPDIYWIHFTGSAVEDILTTAGFSTSGVWSVGTRNRYIELWQRMISELQLERPHYIEIANACLQELLYYFGRSIDESAPTSQQAQTVEKTLHYFYNHYSEDFSVEDYAKDLGISTCWFIRMFKEHTGQSPLQYLTSVRIRQAQELLENPNMAVGQIAEMVGYANPFYFSRQFKNNTGRSPTQYREEYWNHG